MKKMIKLEQSHTINPYSRCMYTFEYLPHPSKC